MSVAIKIENAKKWYGDFEVIKDLSVEIQDGELFTLLGPSGCGKTTLLRMIAGFNTIEGGDFYFNDLRINDIDPSKRNIGMVFQNYAIFPNMSVRKNVEFGLKYREKDKTIIRQRAQEFIDLVQVSDHADKMPEKLSGGQQQRVALARALVIKPKVLLMDEPLSNLDAKLRLEMRSAIRKIQKEVGITTVYVTHDQEEAMAISDRIAIMNFGEILQCDKPQTIYQRPVDLFVASFIGSTNLLKATQIDEHTVALDNGLHLDVQQMNKSTDDSVIVSIRPEDFKITHETENTIKAIVEDSIFIGINTHYTLLLETGERVQIIVESGLGFLYEEGQSINLKVNLEKINVFDKTTERNLFREVSDMYEEKI